MPSIRMTSRICSRRVSSPWPEPYCSAVVPRLSISSRADSARASMGSPARYGIPPARETTSGRLATANRARISDARMPWVRSAYACIHGSSGVPLTGWTGWAALPEAGVTRPIGLPCSGVMGCSLPRAPERPPVHSSWRAALRWWPGPAPASRQHGLDLRHQRRLGPGADHLLDQLTTAVDVQGRDRDLSLIHISEPTRLGMISYAVFCLKKK